MKSTTRLEHGEDFNLDICRRSASLVIVVSDEGAVCIVVGGEYFPMSVGQARELADTLVEAALFVDSSHAEMVS